MRVTQHYLRRSLDHKLTLHMGEVIDILESPITRPAPLGGLFCGNTLYVAPDNELQGGQKKESSVVPTLSEAVSPLFLAGGLPLRSVSKGTKEHRDCI